MVGALCWYRSSSRTSDCTFFGNVCGSSSVDLIEAAGSEFRRDVVAGEVTGWVLAPGDAATRSCNLSRDTARGSNAPGDLGEDGLETDPLSCCTQPHDPALDLDWNSPAGSAKSPCGSQLRAYAPSCEGPRAGGDSS